MLLELMRLFGSVFLFIFTEKKDHTICILKKTKCLNRHNCGHITLICITLHANRESKLEKRLARKFIHMHIPRRVQVQNITTSNKRTTKFQQKFNQ
jgi:hypothetical protein